MSAYHWSPVQVLGHAVSAFHGLADDADDHESERLRERADRVLAVRAALILLLTELEAIAQRRELRGTPAGLDIRATLQRFQAGVP